MISVSPISWLMISALRQPNRALGSVAFAGSGKLSLIAASIAAGAVSFSGAGTFAPIGAETVVTRAVAPIDPLFFAAAM